MTSDSICGRVTRILVLIREFTITVTEYQDNSRIIFKKRENATMKERVLKAVFVAISIALGITLVTFINGEEFSLVKPALYAIIAFAVDFIFSLIFDRKKKA